ncbi:MAG: cysteine--tRNA ligase [Actinomycetota bacterium]
MRFYDTLSRSRAEIAPLEPGRVTIYTCGPTVYRYAHIGNMRTYIGADLLRRALELEGYEVRQVTNITDVGHLTNDSDVRGEDRMLVAVEDEGLSAAEIAQKYTDAYLRHIEALSISPSAVYPKATEHVPQMIELIGELIERGHAYEADGFVYFDVDSFPAYGRLSGNTPEQLRAAHRIEEVDPRKRNHYDFTLWRAAGQGRIMKWPSPWGEGYPGWHIECSAMSIKHLGERFDIHTGGEDNIFPHHEDEIAQSEGAVGHGVVQRWFHGAHLLAEGRKMAKSAQNYYTVDDLVERGFDPLAFRYLVLQTRWRSQMNFTWEGLEAAERGLEKLRKQMAEWASGPVDELSIEAKELDRRFREAVADDLDTPQALVTVSELVASPIDAAEKFHLLSMWDRFLGLDLAREVVGREALPEGAAELIEQREQARRSKDWAVADRLRDQLAAMHVELIDTLAGTRWRITL